MTDIERCKLFARRVAEAQHLCKFLQDALLPFVGCEACGRADLPPFIVEMIIDMLTRFIEAGRGDVQAFFDAAGEARKRKLVAELPDILRVLAGFCREKEGEE